MRPSGLRTKEDETQSRGELGKRKIRLNDQASDMKDGLERRKSLLKPENFENKMWKKEGPSFYYDESAGHHRIADS